ncbi:hypothetical protein ACLOJK_011908 [Asimina triloba]
MAILVVLQAFAWASEAAGELRNGPCDELYVVKEGETIQTISAKCNARFILPDNPHVMDTDDVWPGMVLMVQSR